MSTKWQDLPKKLNVFTVRNARMVNLNTGKVVQYYSANTRITVVQKLVTPEKTYYRTASAEQANLNWAFEAKDFGLPNEKAPSAPSSLNSTTVPDSLAQTPASKTKKSPKRASSKGGGKKPRGLFARIKRIFK